jgi:hypothetical protein
MVAEGPRRTDEMAPVYDYTPKPIDWSRIGPVKFGLITNLNAKKNAKGNYDRTAFENIIGHRGLVRESWNLSNLSEIMDEFKREGVNAIVINGGDGTCGSVFTEAYYTYDELPAFIPLRGGSLNTIAAMLGIPRTSRTTILERFMRQFRRRGDGLVEKGLGTLRVIDSRRPRNTYGLVFACGLSYNLNSFLYSVNGHGSLMVGWAIVRMIGHGILDTKTGREMWPDSYVDITLDGQRHSMKHFRHFSATTLHRLLPVIQPLPEPDPTFRTFTYIKTGLDRKTLVRNKVKVAFNRFEHPGHQIGHAREAVLENHNGGYVLDGECFALDESHSITVQAGFPVRIWALASTISRF